MNTRLDVLGRPHRVFSQPMEVALTALAFLGLHWAGLAGPLPLWLLICLLVASGLVAKPAQARWGPGATRRQIHLRLALEMAGTTAVIYALGWGPTLAVGYLVIVADDLRTCGSAAWRPAIFWVLAYMAAGQMAIALGWAPTYVAAPMVHGLGILAGLGVAFAIRLLGIKTQVVEHETAERARAEQALGASEERFRALVQNGFDLVNVVDATGRSTYVSPSVEWVCGYRPEDYLAIAGSELVHPDDAGRVQAMMEALLARPSEVQMVELRHRHADGTWRWHEVRARNLLDHPAVSGVVINHRDVTEQRAYRDRLAHEARHDPLTGLANRRAFLEALDRALARARRHGGGVAVLFVDLDRFKLVNDSLGHGLGDDLLVEIARRLLTTVRTEDTLARLSGDEFTCVMGNLTHPADATRTAQRMTEALHAPVTVGGRQLVVTASVGVAVTLTAEESAQDILRHADLAMYAAKEGGRARTELFDEASTPQFVDRVELEAGLHSALARGDLEVYYQPALCLATREVLGFEALLRWRHPARGLLPPATFIDIAEDTSLIVPIGAWMLDEACRTLAAWSERAPEHASLVVGVNVSAVQLRHPDFMSHVARALDRSGLEPSRLAIELTESVLVAGQGSVETLAALHAMGVRLALDDFGTGYSSLSYLGRLPLDIVKIDQSFVAGITSGGPNNAIVAAVISLAHSLGLVCVAEGVETPEQATALVSLGCRFAQGYLFGRPGPAEEAERFLGSRNGQPIRANPLAATVTQHHR